MILKDLIQGPAAWKGCDLQRDESWIHHLSAASIAEIDLALESFKARGLSFPEFGAHDFPLPSFAKQLAQHACELETGRGFVLLRGLPIERYSDDEINIIYYGLGVCAAERQLLRTRPDGAFSSIILVAYEQLCASNDRENALAMARSRYADFYRADS